MKIVEVIDALKGERILRGLSLRSLGDELGVSKAKLHNWETGRNRPPYDGLQDWGEALGYTISFDLRRKEAADLSELSDLMIGISPDIRKCVEEIVSRSHDDRDAAKMMGECLTMLSRVNDDQRATVFELLKIWVQQTQNQRSMRGLP